MSRKPQYFVYSSPTNLPDIELVRNDLIPDGWLRVGKIVESRCWLYRAFTEALCCMTLSAEEVDRYENVAVTFSDVLESRTKRYAQLTFGENERRPSIVAFRHNITHPFLVKQFDWTFPQHWSSITLVYINTTLSRVYVEFSRKVEDDNKLSIDGLNSFGVWYDWPCSIGAIYTDYAKLRRPILSILVNSTERDLVQVAQEWKKTSMRNRVLLTGPKCLLQDQTNLLLTKEFVISRTDYTFTQDTWLDAVKQTPSSQAWSRWPMHFKTLFDVCIALLPCQIPPYVVLEIIDWLPYMNYWHYGFKANQIFAIHKSIKRVIRRRVT